MTTLEHWRGSPLRLINRPLTSSLDASCALCSIEINHYAKQNGAQPLCFVDASGPCTETGSNLWREAVMRRLYAWLADGKLVFGAHAFVAVWEILPSWRILARLAPILGVIVLLEGAYRLFLPVRPLLSRVAAAMGTRPRREDADAATSGGS